MIMLNNAYGPPSYPVVGHIIYQVRLEDIS